MQFWRKAERVVEYKRRTVLDAHKREAMDKHLDFLVGQTQRYSTLLAQRLGGEWRWGCLAAASLTKRWCSKAGCLVAMGLPNAAGLVACLQEQHHSLHCR